MPAWISQACYDRFRDPLLSSIVPKIWTSQSIHLFNQLGLNRVVTRNTWTIRDYIIAIVYFVAYHYFSPPSLGHSGHCEKELSDIALVGSLEYRDTSKVT